MGWWVVAAEGSAAALSPLMLLAPVPVPGEVGLLGVFLSWKSLSDVDAGLEGIDGMKERESYDSAVNECQLGMGPTSTYCSTEPDYAHRERDREHCRKRLRIVKKQLRFYGQGNDVVQVDVHLCLKPSTFGSFECTSNPTLFHWYYPAVTEDRILLAKGYFGNTHLPYPIRLPWPVHGLGEGCEDGVIVARISS